jgi:hypothetical protein
MSLFYGRYGVVGGASFNFCYLVADGVEGKEVNWTASGCDFFHTGSGRMAISMKERVIHTPVVQQIIVCSRSGPNGDKMSVASIRMTCGCKAETDPISGDCIRYIHIYSIQVKLNVKSDFLTLAVPAQPESRKVGSFPRFVKEG